MPSALNYDVAVCGRPFRPIICVACRVRSSVSAQVHISARRINLSRQVNRIASHCGQFAVAAPLVPRWWYRCCSEAVVNRPHTSSGGIRRGDGTVRHDHPRRAIDLCYAMAGARDTAINILMRVYYRSASAGESRHVRTSCE